MWYVIQVINGREDVMRERIERMVPAGAMQELFYPQYQTEIKVHGEWVTTTKPLFPGYLICDTADPRTVQQYLLHMDDFARVLAQDGQFVPLAKEEMLLLDEPAAGMNSQEKKELVNTIRKIRDTYHLAVLLVEHDMELVMGISENITVINFGRPIACGTAEEIQSNNDVIEAYLGRSDDE